VSGDDPFLARWSRRKAQAKQGGAAPEARPGTPPEALPPERTAGVGAGEPGDRPAPASTLPQGGREDAPASTDAPEPPPPTLDDVATLPEGADISRFMAPKVDDDVKRAALRKLFADPHFNTMDGLDTYIEDYGRPDPIPLAMLRTMAQSKVLGLFQDEAEPAQETAAPQASPDGAAPPAVPQSATDCPAVPPDENPDLRLQQDHAARPRGTGEGAAG